MRSEEEVSKAIDKYADTVRRICMVHLKNYNDTEDIFQTVFTAKKHTTARNASSLATT